MSVVVQRYNVGVQRVYKAYKSVPNVYNGVPDLYPVIIRLRKHSVEGENPAFVGTEVQFNEETTTINDRFIVAI